MLSKKIAELINIMPSPVATYLSKKILNRYLNKYATIQIEGSEHLQNIKKPTILVCNHLSNADGMVLNRVLAPINPTFVAGVKLSNNAVTNIGIRAVKTTNIKPNSADVKGIKKAVDLVKSGESILIFPEGTRSRSGSMIEAKRGILLIARMTGAPIIPMAIYGTEKLLPISKEGDMSSETFHHADVVVRIGPQFEVPKRDKGMDKKSYETNTLDLIMKSISNLLPREYRGFYR